MGREISDRVREEYMHLRLLLLRTQALCVLRASVKCQKHLAKGEEAEVRLLFFPTSVCVNV